MKNQYEIKLDELLNEYGLAYEEKSDSTKIHNILMDVFKTRCDGKRVALWGAGRKNTENSHAAVILKKYTTYIQGMCCLIDSLPELWGDEFFGYPIISPKDIVKYDVDIVIIASKVQADSIVNDLHRYAPECEYIDIYGELRNRGMMIYHKFYEESNIYTTLYQLRMEYEELEGNDEKERCSAKLKEIIAAHLSIQDFYYAEYYAKKYCEKQYIGYEEIQTFLSKLAALQKEVIEKNRTKTEDVVILFVDSLRAMDVFHKEKNTYQADMFSSYLKDSVVFTNAKSTGVTTYESMISVVKQKYPYEQNVYENNILADFDEFKLLPIAKEQGYDIRFYISEGYPIIHEHEDVSFIKQIYLPSKLWKLTTDMACTKEKTFNFMYVPYELHFPLICGYHEKQPQVSGFVDVGVKDTKDFVPRQLEECKDYVDKTLEYYHDWFSDDILFSVFADHSQVVYDEKEKKPYFMYFNNLDRSVHVTFFIKGLGLEHKWNDSLISLYDLTDIIAGLMKDKQLVVPKREIAVYQYYKIHYKKLREYAEEHGLGDYIDGMQCFVSKDMIYMITATGKEEAYWIGKMKNVMDCEEAQKLKEKVHERFDVRFPEFIVEG